MTTCLARYCLLEMFTELEEFIDAHCVKRLSHITSRQACLKLVMCMDVTSENDVLILRVIHEVTKHTQLKASPITAQYKLTLGCNEQVTQWPQATSWYVNHKSMTHQLCSTGFATPCQFSYELLHVPMQLRLYHVP
ncbi:hypothetical protein RCIP0053_00027 [Klebsiella phage RCIP0053]